MSKDIFLDAITLLDEDLIDDYLVRRGQNLRRLARRRMIRRRVLTAAACFFLILAVTLSAGFYCRYPCMPLECEGKNVSARYVPQWMVHDDTQRNFPLYGEEELFEIIDCIFEGTVVSIDHVRFDIDGHVFFRSIVSIRVEQYYEGSGPEVIRIYSYPVTSKDAGGCFLLDELKPQTQGIFLCKQVSRTDGLPCTQIISSVADARMLDTFSFGFLKDGEEDRYICFDNDTDCEGTVFTSLAGYTREDVLNYLNSIEDGTLSSAGGQYALSPAELSDLYTRK
jgi:hypothetical protein